MFRLDDEWSSLGNENSHAGRARLTQLRQVPREGEEWSSVDLLYSVESN